MKIKVKSLEIQIVLASNLKTTHSSILDVVDKIDVQIEDTMFEEAGYSSSASFLNSLGRKLYTDELNLKVIQIHYRFGEEVHISADSLYNIVCKMMVQREGTELDVNLSSFLVTTKNEQDIVSFEKDLVN